jgi:hypothetical protein
MLPSKKNEKVKIKLILLVVVQFSKDFPRGGEYQATKE